MNDWPIQMLRGTVRQWSVEHLHHNFEVEREDPGKAAEFDYPGQPRLLGFSLPPFQRSLAWDRDRMVRFVESAILGLHIGTYVYNNAELFPMVQVDGRQVMDVTHNWLIDGQQRLTALEWFFSDKFPVFGKLWSEVPRRERHQLLRMPFSAFETSIQDQAELRELYDRLNFGGVAHTQDQRAVPAGEQVLPVSDEGPSAPVP
ncbi:hypothetical protein ACVIGB_000644 [Bradyrhizobium sp. USDA 4341]